MGQTLEKEGGEEGSEKKKTNDAGRRSSTRTENSRVSRRNEESPRQTLYSKKRSRNQDTKEGVFMFSEKLCDIGVGKVQKNRHLGSRMRRKRVSTSDTIPQRSRGLKGKEEDWLRKRKLSPELGQRNRQKKRTQIKREGRAQKGRC